MLLSPSKLAEPAAAVQRCADGRRAATVRDVLVLKGLSCQSMQMGLTEFCITMQAVPGTTGSRGGPPGQQQLCPAAAAAAGRQRGRACPGAAGHAVHRPRVRAPGPAAAAGGDKDAARYEHSLQPSLGLLWSQPGRPQWLHPHLTTVLIG